MGGRGRRLRRGGVQGEGSRNIQGDESVRPLANTTRRCAKMRTPVRLSDGRAADLRHNRHNRNNPPPRDRNRRGRRLFVRNGSQETASTRSCVARRRISWSAQSLGSFTASPLPRASRPARGRRCRCGNVRRRLRRPWRGSPASTSCRTIRRYCCCGGGEPSTAGDWETRRTRKGASWIVPQPDGAEEASTAFHFLPCRIMSAHPAPIDDGDAPNGASFGHRKSLQALAFPHFAPFGKVALCARRLVLMGRRPREAATAKPVRRTTHSVPWGRGVWAGEVEGKSRLPGL